MERLGESEFFGLVIQLPGIGADDLAARSPSHFLEHGIGKKNLIGFVRDDDTVVQCFENGPHPFEPLRFFGPQHALLLPNCSNREDLHAELTSSLTLLSSPQNQFLQECGHYSRFSAEKRSTLYSSRGKRLALRENA
jgi:hypothetical protein